MPTRQRREPLNRIGEEVLDDAARRAAERAQSESAVEKAHEVFGSDVLKGIHDKIAYTMGQIGLMDKEGVNKFHKYQYWSDDQISGYFRSWFSKLGITFRVSVESFDIREHETKSEGRSFLTTGLYRFTLTDVETGETVSDTMLGQGDDPGDKGSNKAVTGAVKYWLLKTFLIGGEDAEADERTDRRTTSHREESRDVVVGDSHIEGIARGGRANKTTDAQIRQIRVLARDLNWNALGAARRISEWLGDELEMPDEPEAQGDALISYLEHLDADDAGSVITKMVDLRDAPENTKEDDDDGYARALSDYP